VAASAGQLLRRSKEGRSDAVSGMVGVDADLLDVRIAVEYLQPDEAYRRIPPSTATKSRPSSRAGR